MTLKKLSIEGFKSISQLIDFEIKSLNVLIGANGAGKSNFVSVFRLLYEIANQNLENYARINVAPSLFFNGPKVTPEIKMNFQFENGEYHAVLGMDFNERVFIKGESQGSHILKSLI